MAKKPVKKNYKNPVVNYSLPDPSIIKGEDGYYYLYATEDIRNLPIHRSKDLVKWEYVGTAFTDSTRPNFEPKGGLWAPDINKIDPSRRVFYQSFQHIKYYMNAKYLLSTHILGFSPEFRSFGKLVKKFKIFDCKGKKIFLQHGITQSYIEYLTKNSVDLDLFVCGAKPEYDFILKNFGFDESVVKYTGFARYDYLKSTKKSDYKKILFMPTWRKELFYLSDSEFVKTNYYKNIISILTN